MEILYLSHCVPNPPNKGEKIRAFHQVRLLSSTHRIHLACFARNPDEVAAANRMADRCASVYVQRLRFRANLGRAVLKFAAGSSFTRSFYTSRRMMSYVRSVTSKVQLDTTIAYSSPMAVYAPAGVPLLVDMVDVDSQKWIQYSSMRRPRIAYRLEGRRLRRWELELSSKAARVFLSTQPECDLLHNLAPRARIICLENGVDINYFDPHALLSQPDFAKPRALIFVGAMDYYPNRDAVQWYAAQVMPLLRKTDPALEFIIVGRNPSPAVCRLAAVPWITVTGTVADVRPYIMRAAACVAPLRIARGIQNKVLEALALGKPVLASPAVCKTFGSRIPTGVYCCARAQDYASAFQTAITASSTKAIHIRRDATAHFSWDNNLQLLQNALKDLSETM